MHEICENINLAKNFYLYSIVIVNIIFLPFQKRQLASQSGIFNLKNTTFCELFPEIVEVSVPLN